MLRGKSLTKEILFMTAAGTLLVSGLFAPNVAQLLKPLLKWRRDWEKIEKRRIREAIRRLNQRRLVRIIKRDGEEYLEITEVGRRYIKKFSYDTIQLDPPEKWDKNWRVVIFDIPKQLDRARDAFRAKLRELGFYQFQKSVFVYPYECQDEIDFIVQCFDIEKYVHYLVAASLHNREGEMRDHFDLPLRD